MTDPAGDDRSAAHPRPGRQPAARPLVLGDLLDTRAAEDRPESWGERAESDDDRLAHYLAQRPPHHGQ